MKNFKMKESKPLSFTMRLTREEKRMLEFVKKSKYLKETEGTLTKLFTGYLQFQYMNAMNREKQRVPTP